MKHSSSQTSADEAEISAKAFELFEMGKEPIQVTIELIQPPKLIQEIYNIWISMKERSKRQKEELSTKLEESYNRGYDDAMKTQHFKAPCSICGLWMDFSSKDRDWKTEIRPRLNKAFSDCTHVHCQR